MDVRPSPTCYDLRTLAYRPSPARAETRGSARRGARSRWPWASAIGRDTGPRLQVGPVEAPILARTVRLIATTQGLERVRAQAPL
jgi:hypothetical protein